MPDNSRRLLAKTLELLAQSKQLLLRIGQQADSKTAENDGMELIQDGRLETEIESNKNQLSDCPPVA